MFNETTFNVFFKEYFLKKFRLPKQSQSRQSQIVYFTIDKTYNNSPWEGFIPLAQTMLVSILQEEEGGRVTPR